jgi:hypothetical protein
VEDIQAYEASTPHTSCHLHTLTSVTPANHEELGAALLLLLLLLQKICSVSASVLHTLALLLMLLLNNHT